MTIGSVPVVKFLRIPIWMNRQISGVSEADVVRAYGYPNTRNILKFDEIEKFEYRLGIIDAVKDDKRCFEGKELLECIWETRYVNRIVWFCKCDGKWVEVKNRNWLWYITIG